MTKIEWTRGDDGSEGKSWNPIRARNRATGKLGWHCEHVTPGCEHCYAEAMNKRLGTWLAFKPGHRKDVELFLDEKILLAPRRWRKPRRIFVCSMTDLFADFIPDQWIDRMFTVMATTPQHRFLVLTKRAARMRDCMNRYLKVIEPLEPAVPTSGPNIWLGVSVEDQARAEERIPLLLQTPGAVRFVSAEPLLGPVDLTPWLHGKPRLDWAIVGGESGSKAHGCDMGWIRSIRDQCATSGAPCFIKQIGSRPENSEIHFPNALVRDRKGGDMSEWPVDLRVREWPR